MSIQILILSGALNQTAIDLFKGLVKVIKLSVSAVSQFASSVDRSGMLESVIKMLTQTSLVGQQAMEMWVIVRNAKHVLKKFLDAIT